MRRNNITTSIGTIDLNNIEFYDNSLDVFIGIESVSAEIQEKIMAAVEIAKVEHIQIIKEHFSNKDLKHFSYRIEIDIEDREDDRVWTSASVEVDLSEYQNELKKVIMKAMIDKFF